MSDIDIDQAILVAHREAARLMNSVIKGHWSLDGFAENEKSKQSMMLYFLTQDHASSPSFELLEMVLTAEVSKVGAMLERVTGLKDPQRPLTTEESAARQQAMDMFIVDNFLANLGRRLEQVLQIEPLSEKDMQKWAKKDQLARSAPRTAVATVPSERVTAKKQKL